MADLGNAMSRFLAGTALAFPTLTLIIELVFVGIRICKKAGSG